MNEHTSTPYGTEFAITNGTDRAARIKIARSWLTVLRQLRVADNWPDRYYIAMRKHFIDMIFQSGE